MLLTFDGLINRSQYWSIWNKDELIKYSKIEKIIHSEEYTFELEMWSTILPGHQSLDPNKIYLKMKDGDVKEYHFFIFKDKMRSFSAMGNKILKQKSLSSEDKLNDI